MFAVILAVLAYLLLRHEKDPLQDLAAPTVDQLAPPPGSTPPADAHGDAAPGG
jgi:hypothetical protein